MSTDKFRPMPAASTVSPPRDSDTIRDAILSRPGDGMHALDRICPAALDATAEALAVLHEGFGGKAVAFAGQRHPAYFREQLRGERPLMVEDLARLLLQAPEQAVPAVAVLLRAAGYSVQPMGEDSGSLRAAAAALSRVGGELAATVMEQEAEDAHLSTAQLDAISLRVDAVHHALSLVKHKTLSLVRNRSRRAA